MTNLSFYPQLRPDRAVISIRGNGALAFLHNLLTCDVANLANGQAAYGALLSPQGKILHDVFVLNVGSEVLLDCAVEQRAALQQKLLLYRLRAKLEINVRDDLEVGVGGENYSDPRCMEIGNRRIAATGTLQLAPGYDEARIALGLADSVGDIGSNILFPHEANFDQFGGVSFSKGCYVGQEVVSRMQHRGTARGRILPISFAGDIASGAIIFSGEKKIGEVLSTVPSRALALIRIDHLADATAQLLADGKVIKVHKPDWIKYDVADTL
jgi:tRNA-modifying protein YgfZ